MVWGFFPRLSLCTCFLELTCGVVISCILPQVFRDEWVLHPAILWMLAQLICSTRSRAMSTRCGCYMIPWLQPWKNFNNFEPKTLNQIPSHHHRWLLWFFRHPGCHTAFHREKPCAARYHDEKFIKSPFREGTWREDQIIWKNSRWKWSDLWHLKVLRWNNWKTMHCDVQITCRMVKHHETNLNTNVIQWIMDEYDL